MSTRHRGRLRDRHSTVNHIHSDSGTTAGAFIGREQELAWLLRLWREATLTDTLGRFIGGPRLAFVLAETGLGKSRLVQALYTQLVATCDPAEARYWPDGFGGHEMRVNPVFDGHTPSGPPAFLWLGARWQPPDARNVEERTCVLPDVRHSLQAHVRTALTHAPLWRRTRAAATGLLKDEGAMSAIEQAVELTELVPFGGLLLKVAQAGRAVFAERASTAEQLARAQADAADALLDDLHEVFGGFGGDGIVLPTVLWLDDAQWMDGMTKTFLHRLWRIARDKRWPLLVVVTHWEREWHAAVETERDDPGALHRYFDDQGVEGCVLAPAPPADLSACLAAALPGLTKPQHALMIDKAAGNFLTLVENIGMLTAQPANFVRRRADGALTAAGERQVTRWESTRERRIAQRFAALDPPLQDLLGWSSRAGHRFPPRALTGFAGERLGQDEASTAGLYDRAVRPYAVLEASSPLLREFRDRAFHAAARSYFDEYQKDADEDALAACVRHTLASWVNAMFDSTDAADTPATSTARPRLGDLQTHELREVLDIALRELPSPGDETVEFDAERTAALRAAALHVDTSRLDRLWPLAGRLAPLFRGVAGPAVPAVVLPEELVLDVARAFTTAGVHDVARLLYAHEIALRDSGARSGETSLPELLRLHALASVNAGDRVAARAALDRALRLTPAADGEAPSALDAVPLLLTLARIEEADAHWTAAATRVSRAIDLIVTDRGPEHALLVTPLINLGVIHERAGRPDLAVPVLERARAIAADAGVDAHTIVQLQNALAEAYRALGHHDRAEPLYRDALARIDRDRGGDHPEAAVILNNLALIRMGAGRHDEAEALLQRAVEIVDARAGNTAAALCTPLANLAHALLRQGQLARALPLAERALTIGEHTRGAGDPDTVFARYVLGSLLHDAGDLDAAETHLLTALEAQRTLFGAEHPAVAATLSRLDVLRQARAAGISPAPRVC